MKRAVPLVVAGAMLALVAPASSASRPTPYTITTQNVLTTLGNASAGHDLRQAQSGSDIAITQENGRRRASSYALAGFATVQLPEVPELATYVRRSAFRIVDAYPILLSKSRLFRSATRVALVTKLRPRTAPSSCLLVVNVHMIPHIETGGRPRDLPRLALAARAIRYLVSFVHVSRLRCSLIVGGDWNVDGNADARVGSSTFPFRRLTATGLRSEWARFPRTLPTLGSRRIDGFYATGIRMTGRRTILRTFSDHNGDRLRFELSR